VAVISQRKRIFGWMMFDWASQPYATLLQTFIFGPYFAAIVADSLMAGGLAEDAADARAQTMWSLGQTVAGLIVAFSAPFLGAVADASGRRMPWIWGFSALYVFGAGALWWTYPDASTAPLMLIAFGIGFIGLEFTTIFTNALLPDLGPRDEVGAISGSGFALGYAGGVISLLLMLLLLLVYHPKTVVNSWSMFDLLNHFQVLPQTFKRLFQEKFLKQLHKESLKLRGRHK